MKTISQFGFSPSLFIDLSDRAFSVFVDPDTGNVFLDEGTGEDRINGAVLYGHKNPAFAIKDQGETARVWVHYCNIDYILGDSPDKPSAHDWVRKANSLVSGDPLTDVSTTSSLSLPEIKNNLFQLCIEKAKLFTRAEDSLTDKERLDKEIITVIGSALLALGVFAFAYAALKMTGASTESIDQEKAKQNQGHLLRSLNRLAEATRSDTRSKSEAVAVRDQITEARQLMGSAQ